MKLSDVKVDAHFSKRIRPLSDYEFKMLRKEIELHGCRDALVVWKEEGLLLDGHNRRKICLELGIDPKIELMSFSSKERAERWILMNQLGKRNLSRPQYMKVLGEFALLVKRGMGRPSTKEDSTDKMTLPEIAAQHNVSVSTVKKAIKAVQNPIEKKSAPKKKTTAHLMIEVSLQTKAYLESMRMITTEGKREPIGKVIDRLVKKKISSAGTSR